MKPPFKFDARSNEINYTAKAVVGTAITAFLYLAVPFILLIFSIAFIYVWVDLLHLPA